MKITWRFVPSSLFLILLFISSTGSAQTKRALLIGVDKYQPADLQSMPPSLATGHKPDSRFGLGYIAWKDLYGPATMWSR